MRILSLVLVSIAAVCLVRAHAGRGEVGVMDKALVAAWEGDGRALERLIRDGLHPDTEVLGVSLLGLAASGGHAGAVETLIACGARVEGPLGTERTPLMLAALGGNAETVRVLLAAGADADAVDPVGFTVLMFAAASGDAERVRVLLEAGADAGHRSPSGNTAADWAAVHEREEIVRLLAEGGVAGRVRPRP